MAPREHNQGWDIEGIAKAFGTTGEATRDIAFGEGLRFPLSEDKQKSLEVYPGPGFLRLTTQDAQIALYRLRAPKVEAGVVVFQSQTQEAQLSLSPQGEVTVFVAFRGSEATSLAKPEEEEKPLPAPQEPASPSEQPRLTLFGRVGANPSFRTTPKGVLIGRFPLAVREEEKKTTWHTVLAFGERAEKMKDSLKKGDAVEIIGYRHFRNSRTKDGRTKTVEELYAVVVKNR